MKRYTARSRHLKKTGYFTVVHRKNSSWYWHKTKASAMSHAVKVTPWDCMVVNAETGKAIWKHSYSFRL